MEEIKQQIEKFINDEVVKGTRKVNLEIELMYFIKRVLYTEQEDY